MPNPTELAYFAARAEREAVLAVVAGTTPAAAAHAEMSRLYSAEVVRRLAAATRA